MGVGCRTVWRVPEADVQARQWEENLRVLPPGSRVVTTTCPNQEGECGAACSRMKSRNERSMTTVTRSEILRRAAALVRSSYGTKGGWYPAEDSKGNEIGWMDLKAVCWNGWGAAVRCWMLERGKSYDGFVSFLDRFIEKKTERTSRITTWLYWELHYAHGREDVAAMLEDAAEIKEPDAKTVAAARQTLWESSVPVEEDPDD